MKIKKGDRVIHNQKDFMGISHPHLGTVIDSEDSGGEITVLLDQGRRFKFFPIDLELFCDEIIPAKDE